MEIFRAKGSAKPLNSEPAQVMASMLLGRTPKLTLIHSGLVSATLAALGFNALATDVPAVIESVTAPNAASAASAGAGYHVQALDWHDALSDRTPSSQDESRRIVEDEYDVILTADTVYSPALNRPLVSTLRRLARRGPGRPPPTTLVALERRDPLLVEQFFALASEAFACERVDPGKIKEMVSGLGWSEDDWDGVEIWSLRLRDAMQDG